jgi:hypothetical protein
MRGVGEGEYERGGGGGCMRGVEEGVEGGCVCV